MTSRTVRKLSTVLSDALLKSALEDEREPRTGMPIRKRIQRVADAMMKRAENGDVEAAKFIAERLEGKPVQQVSIDTDTRLTVTMVGMMVRGDDAQSSGMSKHIEGGLQRPALIDATPVVDVLPSDDEAPLRESLEDAHAALRARILASLADE